MLRRIGILLLICLMGCSEGRETRMQRFLIQGNEKFELQEYDEASGYFREALTLDSCFADAWHNLATVEFRKSNLKTALGYYSRAIECKPSFAASYLGRANIFYELNELESALRDLRSAEKLTSDTLTLYYIRGLVQWRQHKPKEAMSQFKRILRTRENDPDVFVNIGTLYGELRQFDSGRFYLHKALASDSKDSRAMNAFAILEAEAGNGMQANEWIDKALALNSDEAFYLNNKGYILLLMNDTARAITYINKSIAKDPYNGWAYRNKGLYYYKTGKIKEAVRLLTQAEKIDPFIDRIYYWLGEAHLADGNTSHGCDYLRKAVAAGDLEQAELSKRCR